MPENRTGSQAVIRALRLLKLFNGERTILTTNDAVALTGLNRTTAFRLLNTLEEEGFLERDTGGGYRLGSVPIALGGYALRNNHLQQVARPLMEELVHMTGERATLEILSSDSLGRPTMLVVDEVSSSHRLGVQHFFGNHLPLHATSTGKVMLAFLSADDRPTLPPFPLERFTENTWVDEGVIQKGLEEIRAVGYGVAVEELEIGLVALAAPIFNSQQVVRAALCLTGPTVRLTSERISAFGVQLKQTAAQISKRIGYQN